MNAGHIAATVFAVLVLHGFGFASFAAAPPSDQELAALEAELRQPLPPVAEQANAAVLLQQAIEGLGDEPVPDEVAEAGTLIYRAPRGRRLRTVRQYLAKRQEALRLFNEAATRPRYRALDTKRPSMSSIRRLTQLAQAAVRVALMEGRTEDAVSQLLAIRRVGRLIQTGSVSLGIVMGRAMLAIADHQIGQAAADFNDDQLARLQRDLLRDPVAAPRDELIRHFADMFGEIDRAQRGAEETPQQLRKLGTELDDIGREDILFSTLALPARLAIAAKELERRGHAVAIIDVAATRRELLGDLFAAASTLDAPWAALQARAAELDATEDLVEAELMSLIDAIDAECAKPRPDDAALARLAKRMDNALGRHVRAMYASTIVYSAGHPRHAIVEHRAALLRLSMRRYMLRHGMKPQSLQTLVAAELLPAIPNDAYGDGAMHYDPARGRIWSVWFDGVDHGGEGDSDRGSKDLVWDVPAPRKVQPWRPPARAVMKAAAWPCGGFPRRAVRRAGLTTPPPSW